MLLTGQQSGRTVLARAGSRKRCINVIALHQNVQGQQQQTSAGVHRRSLHAAMLGVAAMTLLPAQDAQAG